MSRRVGVMLSSSMLGLLFIVSAVPSGVIKIGDDFAVEDYTA